MSEGLNILMVAPEPVFEPRGTPFSVVYRARSLCRAGHRVDLLTYPYGRDPKIDGLRVIRVPKVPGVRGVRIGPSPAKVVLDAMLTVRMAGLLSVNAYDLIWSHEEAGLLCGPLSRLLGVAHIYDMHSDLSQQIMNYAPFDRQPFVGVFSGITRVMVHTADVVLTICDDLVSAVRTIAPRKRVLLVENYCTAVDFLDDPVPSVDAVRREMGLNGVPTAVYIGSLEPYQGLDILLGAADYLAGRKCRCKMVIVGGSAGQVERLRERAASMNLGDVVHVVGQVPPAAVASYVEAADILLTSRSMGTNVPLKIYSYMKSGKPIVATRIESHTQLLSDENAMLSETDGTSFGRAIERLIDNPGLGRRLAEAAGRSAGDFSEERFDRNLALALEWAMASRRGT